MIDLELTFKVNHIIFITLIVTFGLYCILLSIFSVLTKGIRKPVYFLSDIPSHYCYGYLIIVKTANRRNAGTTSNVIFKLYGSQSNSDEHVLNYPDPDMYMLQQNQEDWFFLATECSLGEINKIEIWIDSIGQRPTWYCSEIEILDLQMTKYCIFDVNFLFSIKEDGHLFFTSAPANQYEKDKLSVKTIFGPKFLMRILGRVIGPHMWNIFKSDVQLSKVKRISLMFSICLTIYTVTIFFYGIPHLKYSDSLSQFTEYWFHPQMFLASFISVLVASIVHVPIVWLFRLAAKRQKNSGKKITKIKDYCQDFSLLRNTICWSVLIFIIVSTMLLLLIFGFWVPQVSGLLWLTSSLMSLFVYIFIVENVIRSFVSTNFKNVSREEQIIGQIENVLEYVDGQRNMLYKKFGPLLLKPYFEQLYRKADAEKIKEQKLKANMKEHLLELLEDLIMIVIYVVVLYIIILYGRDVMDYKSNKETTELITGIHSKTVRIDEIRTMGELQSFLKDTLVYSLQSPNWYGKFVSRNPGMTIDYSNKYIGVARLRQHRSDNTSCDYPHQMKFLNISCISTFELGRVFSDFGEEWGNDSDDDPMHQMGKSWKYTSSKKAGTFPYNGILGIYPGGGYITPLGRTQRNSIIVLQYLALTNWMDRHSRALFVEFLLYSPNSNLFNYITIIFEFSSSGYILHTLDIYTSRLLLIKEKTSNLMWIVYVAFNIIIISLAVKTTIRIVNKKKIYFKDVMNCVDIVIICLSVTCLFMYTNRSRLVAEFLKRLQEAKNNDFINFFHLFYSDWIYTYLAALLVFLATFRLWKLVRFLLIIKIVEKTLVLCFKPILCLFIWQLIILLSYGFASLLLFEDDSVNFTELQRSIITLLIRSLGFQNDFKVEAFRSQLQVIFYISFMIINLLINTLYITIITISYNDAQVIFSNIEEYNVIDFLKEKVHFFLKLLLVRIRNYRLRGGQNFEEIQLVYPKLKHRFAQCITSPKSKMEAMLFVTLCILRKVNRKAPQDLNKRDNELIKSTVVSLFRVDSKDCDIFYISNLEGFKKSLVDDNVFVKMETVANYLVTEEKTKSSDRQKELYENICQYQKKKMEKINECLSLLLSIVNQIEFES